MADVDDSTPMSNGEFALTVADLNTAVNHEPRVEDLRLAAALGMERPREIRRLIERHREALERFGEVCVTVTQTSRQGGRPGRTFWLNKRQALYLCTKSETPRATETTIAMVEVFDAHLARSLPTVDPDVVGLNQVLQSEMPAGDFAFLRIGRRTVMLDTKRFRPGPKDEAALLHPDGRITIGTVQQSAAPWSERSPRGAMEKVRRPRKGEAKAAWVADHVQVLGVVIKPSLPAAVGGGARSAPNTKPAAMRPLVPRRRSSAILPVAVPPAALIAGSAAPPTRH